MTKLVLDVQIDSHTPATLTVSWDISENDASMWRQPMSLSILPNNWREAGWETTVTISRQDMRLLRDFLSTFLEYPDIRHDDELNIIKPGD